MRIKLGHESRHKRPWERPDTTILVEKRSRPIHRSSSFWIAMVVVALLALQWFPSTGTIAAMLGALWLSALLINLLALSVGLEALLGVIPRWLIVAPILYFGGYYSAREAELRAFQATEQRLQSENTQTARQFDIEGRPVLVPYRYRMLAAHYELDSAFSAPGLGPTNGVTTHWTPIIEHRAPNGAETTDLPCDRSGYYARDDAGDWLLHQVDHLMTREEVMLDDRRVSFCVRVAVADTGPDVLEVRETPYEMAGVGRDFEATRFLVTTDGAIVGSAIAARTWLLNPFPFLMSGCFLISGPSARTQCDTQFQTTLTSLSTDPHPTPNGDRQGPAIALDLAARTMQ